MNCPRCKNIGFIPTEEFRKPVIVHKTIYGSISNERILICIQCGNAWKTTETFKCEIEIKGFKVMQMIENAQERIAEERRNTIKQKHNGQQKLFDKKYLDN
jgi:hypothetical protein